MKTFKNSLKLLMTLVLLFNMTWLFAGAPTWTRVDYTNTTTFTGEIVINDYEDPDLPVDAGDYIGAFVNGECRMITQIFDNAGTLYISAVLHGGDLFGGPNDPELVEFRLWDDDSNTEYDLMGTTMTDPGNHISLYPVGAPNTGNDIATLAVTGVTLIPVFDPATLTYNVDVPNGGSVPSIGDYNITLDDPRATVDISEATDLSGNNVTTITVTAEDGTTKVYTITFTQEVCTAQAPSASDKEVCENGNYELTATSTGTTKWYSNEDKTGYIQDGATYTAPGAGTYYAANDNGTCISETTPVTLVVNTLPVVTITSGTTVCINEDLNITADVTTSLTYTAAWTGDITPLTATDDENTVFNAASATTYNLTLTITDAKACVGTDAIAITVNDLPAVSIDAVADPVCQGDNAITLTATNPGGGTATWSGDGINSSTGEFTPSSSGSFAITYSYEDGNGCIGTDQTTVEVAPKPTYAISGGGNFCPGTTQPDVTISLYGTSPWSITYTDGTTPTSETVTTSPFTISQADAGTYELTAISDDSGCAGVVDAGITVDVTETAPPAMPTASSETVCSGQAAILTATGTDIKWYDNQNLTGTPVLGATYNTGITAPGSYSFWVTQTDGCESPAREVALTVKAAPAAPTAGSVEEVCENATIPTLSFNETGLKWYSDANATMPLATADTYTPTSVSVGLNQFYATQDVAGCESTTGMATITVKAIPAAPSAQGNSICQGANNEAITAVGTGITWYYMGGEIAQGNSFVPADAGTYTATQTVAGCEGTGTDVQYIINALPVVELNGPAAVCIDGTVSLTTAPAGGTITIDGTVATEFVPANVGAGSHTVVYTYTDNNVCTNSATVSIEVNQTAKPTPASGKTTFQYTMVKNGTVPTLAVTATGTVTWYAADGVTVIPGTSIVPAIDASIAPASYTYFATNTENNCESEMVEVTLQVSDCQLAPPTVASAQIDVCPGDAYPLLTATGTGVTWYSNSALTAVVSTVDTYQTTAAGTYYATSKDATCESVSTSVTVSDVTLPAVSISGVGAYTCEDAGDITLVGSPVGGQFSGDGVTGGLFNPANVSGSSPVAITYTYTQGTCSSTAMASTTIQAVPSATINGAPTVACSGSAAINLVAYGAPANGVFSGENVSGGMFTPGDAKDYVITYTVTTNGCAGSANHTITVNEKPAAPSVTSIADVCQNSAPIDLSSAYNWYTNAQLTATAQNPYPTATAGTVTLYATESGTNCESEAAIVVFAIDESPAAPVAKTFYYLTSATVQTMTIASSNIVKWYDANMTYLDQGTSYTPATVLPKGTYTFYATESSNGGCESEMAAMTLVVSDCQTSLPVASSLKICEGDVIPDLVASGTDLKWYDVADGGTVIETGANLTPTTNGVGVYKYYVTQTDVCESERLMVSLTINANPIVSISAESIVHQNDGLVSFSLTPQGGTVSGTGITGNKFDPTAVTPDLTYVITYTYTDANGCEGQNTHSITVTSSVLNYSALEALLLDVTNTIDSTVVGNANGQYSSVASDALETQKTSAEAVLTAALAGTTTQDAIDQAVSDLQVKYDAYLTSRVVFNVADLEEAIQNAKDTIAYAIANNLINSSSDEAAKATLQTAIETAETALTTAESQTAIDDAKNALEDAIAAFIKTVNEIKPTDVDIADDFMEMSVGEAKELIYAYVPANSNVQTPLSWTSNKPGVVTVVDGVVTAVGPGTATISVSFEGETNIIDQVVITVLPTSEGSLETAQIKVYPTKVKSTVTIEGGEVITSVLINSVNGGLVKSIKPNADVIMIDLTDLNSGTYTVTITTISGNVVTEKIIK